MIAFYKIDGSNIRIKWTPKKGFCLFGSRTQLIDETHPSLGGVIPLFMSKYSEVMDGLFRYLFKGEKEIYLYGEYYGPKSFAGRHYDSKEDMLFSAFDILIQKNGYTEFVLPQDFIKEVPKYIPTPPVVYSGNLTDQFVLDVRNNQLDTDLHEGVVCKGTQRNGAYRGKVWMCKIKTLKYFELLKSTFGDRWKSYGE
jgi:hypothetical protein